MTAELEAVHPVLMVRDVTASIRFYALLGFEAVFRDRPIDPQYAGVRRDRVELHLQWHEAADFSDGDRPNYRFVVREVDALSAELAPHALDRTPVAITPGGRASFMCATPTETACSSTAL